MKIVQTIETRICLVQKLFFDKLSNVKKDCRAGQATNDNMAQAHYMLDT